MSEEQTELSFEASLDRLETLVAELEAGQVPLEQALAKFEEAMHLKARCEELLAQAEAKVEELTAAPEASED